MRFMKIVPPGKARPLLFLLTWLCLLNLSAEDALSAPVITAPEVKQMMERDDALLVHVLSRIEFAMQHISGSINIPIDELKTTDQLPLDKTRNLIFYCMGSR